jgi:hypothetical protein
LASGLTTFEYDHRAELGFEYTTGLSAQFVGTPKKI